ncbi:MULTISPECIES: hypothetical protein [unclassified Enterococcus]|uniref:hypothetical protein n=1 Tax=unclassified Enterococcus TaxID=2608891 RepID=UPI0013EB1DDA|nr:MULTISPECIES: hypothetical protein [unclassified Enterococcus]
MSSNYSDQVRVMIAEQEYKDYKDYKESDPVKIIINQTTKGAQREKEKTVVDPTDRRTHTFRNRRKISDRQAKQSRKAT